MMFFPLDEYTTINSHNFSLSTVALI